MNEQKTEGVSVPLDCVVGRYGHILPPGQKSGDECPWCKESGHTGVLDRTTGKYIVCKVCGDKGVIDAVSIAYYGTPRLTPNTEADATAREDQGHE